MIHQDLDGLHTHPVLDVQERKLWRCAHHPLQQNEWDSLLRIIAIPDAIRANVNPPPAPPPPP